MISIIIPCYNAASTLTSTIESALTQDADREIIVVNDGSTDKSQDIICSFGNLIRSHATVNRGVSAARNTGCEIARGRFIQFLDSDDLLLPGTLEARRSALEAADGDVAHTDWQKLDLQPDGSYVPGEIVCPDMAVMTQDIECATATSRFWAPPAALLYRRRIVDRIGPWPAGLPVIQDARYLFEAAAEKAIFVYVPGIGAQYRQSPGSLSRSSKARFLTDCVRNTEEIEAIWRQRGSLSATKAEALRIMWSHVAIGTLFEGLEEFEVARIGFNRVAGRRLLIEAGYALRCGFGVQHSARLLRLALRTKAGLREMFVTMRRR